MKVIVATNPDNALMQGLSHLITVGEREESRVGPVLVAPTPVTTVFMHPRARISQWPIRDANPFFHLAEALWMLLGREDVETVARYAERMAEFSDDGRSLHGAYGYRWRKKFGYDQIRAIVEDLRRNPSSRRAVLTMWDPGPSSSWVREDYPERVGGDLGTAAGGGKDVPCNTQAYFRVRGGDKLDMTVTCRSNDIVWGAYGANVVHFSFLQEFVAESLGLRVGQYYQVSNNYHAYIERPDVQRLLDTLHSTKLEPQYNSSYALFEGLEAGDRSTTFLNEASAALDGVPSRKYESEFIGRVVVPMLTAHTLFRAGEGVRAATLLNLSDDPWLRAGHAWIQRRLQKTPAVTETRA